MPRKQTNLTERKARFKQARAELERGITQIVTTAFYSATSHELMFAHGWTSEQVAAFLEAVTLRAGVALAMTETHRQARESEV